jgi:hypothetical protein
MWDFAGSTSWPRELTQGIKGPFDDLRMLYDVALTWDLNVGSVLHDGALSLDNKVPKSYAQNRRTLLSLNSSNRVTSLWHSQHHMMRYLKCATYMLQCMDQAVNASRVTGAQDLMRSKSVLSMQTGNIRFAGISKQET